ncbi:Type-1 restriction enzyme EcoEI specificity protein [Vibrio chagasii]|nr:Type-1 restriction enzyme EcoEI specificity protein [Vibrio chagasii]CAH6852142.1 Type-1 restriction enzyme EcoEI specificity protein [Vibrio chagasii]CAH6878036.1 Type-1 restriction enzyme EcoEI specificity protein [Vibrio chagasii]CAH7030761.1 Type-1 restriction enzyme EcoEI specificity protein [Vibrio chagasii]CAH7128827.1 Type-1 restriction enzyme EcoEI specificity protein [Vibrio chagasii]
MSVEQTSMNQLITDNIDVWTSTVKTKSASGRGSRKKRELYGVKKLRELILELAVRGKLVPQDPTDEPASVLLDRIAEEKAQLVKEKKIKKPKLLPPLASQDLPNLPQGWEWAYFPDIADYAPGKTPATKNAAYWDETKKGVPWISIADLNDTGIVEASSKKVSEVACEQVFKKNPVRSGTMLMSFKLTVGKVSILDVDAYHNEAIISIFPYTGIQQNYLFKVLPSIANSGNKKNAIMGFTLNSESLAQLTIPVPPTIEQHRIVTKVDELMTLCDQLEQQTEASIEAHQVLVTTLLDTLTNSADAEELMQNWTRISEHFDTLFTTEESIEQLKQTILQLAVMGKLLPQDPNDEPAAKLLERIAEEKAQLIKDKKIKKQKALPPIADDEKPFELPNGWEWCRLGNLINLISGQHLKPSEYSETPLENGNPYITGPAEFGPVYPSFSKYTTEKRALAEDGDILITCKGAGLGKLNQANQTLAISRQLMAMQSICINREFLFAIVDSKYDYFQSKGVGIAIPGISREDVNDLEVALPPLNEQSKIISKLKEILIICDQLKQRLFDSQQIQLQLTDEIVGEFVSSTVKTPVQKKDSNKDMMISTTLSITDVCTGENSPISLLVKQEGGTAEAKEIWMKTKLSLPQFYQQLKKEIEAGYLKMPTPAVVNNN